MGIEISKSTKIGLMVIGFGMAFRLLSKGEKTTLKEQVQTTGDGSLKGIGNVLILFGVGGIVITNLIKK